MNAEKLRALTAKLGAESLAPDSNIVLSPVALRLLEDKIQGYLGVCDIALAMFRMKPEASMRDVFQLLDRVRARLQRDLPRVQSALVEVKGAAPTAASEYASTEPSSVLDLSHDELCLLQNICRATLSLMVSDDGRGPPPDLLSQVTQLTAKIVVAHDIAARREESHGPSASSGYSDDDAESCDG